MWTGRPDASHAASARARRSARASVGSIGVVLVDPAALPVAIDRRGAEIADPASAAPRRSASVQVEHGIAGLVRGDRGQDVGDAGQRLGAAAAGRGRTRTSRQPWAASACCLLRPAGGAADLPAARREPPRQGPGRVAEPEAEQGAASRAPSPIPRARPRPARLRHAPRGAGASAPPGQAAPAPRPPPPAPAARIAQERARPPAASAGSPLLPIATSTLRTNRSRPIRLTGLPAKRRRKPASSSAASSASGGCHQVLARLQLQLARWPARTCSRGRRRGSRRSRRSGCP